MSTTTAIKPDLGISDDARTSAVNLLRPLLADHFVLYTKLRNYHWNVTGAQFFDLHAKFEELYDGMAETVDVLAERVRAYGEKATGTLKEFLEQTRLSEQPGEYPDARTMVANLLADFESLVRWLGEALETADDLDDDGLEDLFTSLRQDYEKTAWMLRAYLED